MANEKDYYGNILTKKQVALKAKIRRTVKLAGTEGINYDVLKKKLHLTERQANPPVMDLLNSGEMFEQRPGNLRYLST